MESEQTAKVLNDWYAAIAESDFPNIMNRVADDIVFVLGPKPHTEMIPYLRTWVGKEAFAEASRIRNEASRITGFALRDLVAQDNKGVALLYTKAICLATGKEFELKVIQWTELDENEKISKCEAIFDPTYEINAFTPDV
jgi:ketosteroid isomerase-like protein